jgi:hypothetical protein
MKVSSRLIPIGAFLLSCLLSFLFLAFYAPIFAITGFYYQPVSAVQMIGSFMVPGKPVANMMFTLYGSNSSMFILSRITSPFI